MKTLLIAAAAALAVGAPALAASSPAPNSNALSGVAPTVCVMSAPTINNADATLVSATANASAVQFSNFASPANAQLTPNQDFTLTVQATCNYAHSFGLKSQNGGLKNTTTSVVGGSFIQSVNYTVGGLWGLHPIALQTFGLPNTKSFGFGDVDGANRGSVVLAVSLNNPLFNRPLVAGAFTDVLTLQLGAPL